MALFMSDKNSQGARALVTERGKIEVVSGSETQGYSIQEFDLPPGELLKLAAALKKAAAIKSKKA